MIHIYIEKLETIDGEVKISIFYFSFKPKLYTTHAYSWQILEVLYVILTYTYRRGRFEVLYVILTYTYMFTSPEFLELKKAQRSHN